MPSELRFSQPCAEASGSGSVLIVALGNEGLGGCNEQSGDQQRRKNDSRTALSCLRGEQQHGLATKTTEHTGRTGDKGRLLQTFVAESNPQQITTGKRKSSPCTASTARVETDGVTHALEAPEATDG